MKVIKGIFITLLALIVVGIGFIAGIALDIYVINPTHTERFVSGDLSIHFLELGNKYTGDCIFIQCGDNDILIDAGSRNNSASTIIDHVDQYVTDNTLEYVIATHGHEDHISAFYSESDRTGIFDYYNVENIIDFPLTNGNVESNRTVVGKYTLARDAEVEAGANHWTALECYNNENGASRVIELSADVEMEILYNYYYDHTDSSGENNYSVCLMINQGDNHYLFTGDLEEKGETRLVNYYEENHGGLPHCVLYKAGHHGSKTSSCPELMEAISPEYVIVCCCAGTSEYTDTDENQFPTQEFINNVAPYTDKIYVTSIVDNYVDKSDFSNLGTVKSMNGNIIFSVSGSTVKLEFSNNDLKLKDTDWFKAHRTWPG